MERRNRVDRAAVVDKLRQDENGRLEPSVKPPPLEETNLRCS